MKSWKTMTGAILTAVGSGLLGAHFVAPSDEISRWCLFLGTFMSGAGGSVMGVGIAHRITKTSEKVAKTKREYGRNSG